jgi:serine/threonine protein phosphatase PrpC
MRQASFVTKLGSTADVRPGSPDVILASEPTLGATLRTKGRFYFLCEVARQHGTNAAADLAREVADLARQEYYYDLSAGIEVSLRKALRQANRRAAQRLRDQRGRIALHCACAVVVNNELYAARIGTAQVFLVRRARLFLPGDEPGELADFVHRTTTREAPSLGSVADVLPDVWRQSVEPGDTLILAAGGLIEGLGAEALKNAAVTLHPRAAAEHVHNRAVADGVTGSIAALFIEITASSSAAARVMPEPEVTVEPTEVVIADTIRSRVDSMWRHRPRIAEAITSAAVPATKAVGKTVAVGFELMPRRAPPLPRRQETARDRSRRRRRAASFLAVGLLVVAGLIGGLAYRDYAANRVAGDYQLEILTVENELSAAQRFADRKPPDNVSARQKLDEANVALEQAARSPAADPSKIAALRTQYSALDDRVTGVVVDLAHVTGPDGKPLASSSKPATIIGNVNGLYVADPGGGRLWRVFGDPTQVGTVLAKGDQTGAPRLVASQGEVLYSVDDAKRIFRAQGNKIEEVTPDDADRWKTVDAFVVFLSNLYVLDATSGQVWKHESRDGVNFGIAQAYLADTLAPNAVRSLAIDADIWLVTTSGEVLRYRRLTTSFTATRVDFQVKWTGSPAKPIAIQAIDSQRNIYLLDATARLVIQLTRDGNEIARFALPANLPEPTGFYVSEGSRTIYTLQGSKVVGTELKT